MSTSLQHFLGLEQLPSQMGWFSRGTGSTPPHSSQDLASASLDIAVPEDSVTCQYLVFAEIHHNWSNGVSSVLINHDVLVRFGQLDAR